MAERLSSSVPSNVLSFPTSTRSFLQPYLPDTSTPQSSLSSPRPPRPHVTLTYAASLDSALSLAPGTQTVLSGPESKAMTHFLRSEHDAILVGVGTAIADDPGLNCRLEGVGGYGAAGVEKQPRPIVIDPRARWDFVHGDRRLFKTVKAGKGKAPWMIYSSSVESTTEDHKSFLESHGGLAIYLPSRPEGNQIDWGSILTALAERGIKSIMIEGGATVVTDLLDAENAKSVDSVIVTIAPTYLGQGSSIVSPRRRTDKGGAAVPATRFQNVAWQPLGEDVVMCGNIS
ncbi:MAG: hypothetical protein M1819_000782 [Sarea resinae]|nr:MAG: hypothetical protein M1819_000782 [Sarea resinae]